MASYFRTPKNGKDPRPERAPVRKAVDSFDPQYGRVVTFKFADHVVSLTDDDLQALGLERKKS